MQIKHTEYNTNVIIDGIEYAVLGLHDELPDWFLNEAQSLAKEVV